MLICALFFVAIAPAAVVGQFAFTYRITLTMTALVMLALWWLLCRAGLPSTVLAALFATTGCAMAFADIYGTSAFDAGEYRIVHEAVSGIDPQVFHPIIEFRPVNRPKAFGLGIDNDFGGLPPSEGIFDQIIGTRYNGDANFDVSSFRLGDPATKPMIEKNAVIVDLSPNYGLPPLKDFSKFPIVASNWQGSPGPLNVVSGTGAFWEVCNEPFPYELEIDFPTAQTFRGYRMATGIAPNRMPQSWIVSVRRSAWENVSNIAHAPAWQANERREFIVAPIADVTAVKLTIFDTAEKSCMRLNEFRLLLEALHK